MKFVLWGAVIVLLMAGFWSGIIQARCGTIGYDVPWYPNHEGHFCQIGIYTIPEPLEK